MADKRNLSDGLIHGIGQKKNNSQSTKKRTHFHSDTKEELEYKSPRSKRNSLKVMIENFKKLSKFLKKYLNSIIEGNTAIAMMKRLFVIIVIE